MNTSPEDFEKAGFKPGDSVNVSFENGLKLEGIPYYDGYYVKRGDPLVVNYPGEGIICITYAHSGIRDTESLEEGEGVTISLNTREGYNIIQDTIGQVHSFHRDDYDSDEEYCNFRPFLQLYKENKVIPSKVSADYESEEYRNT